MKCYIKRFVSVILALILALSFIPCPSAQAAEMIGVQTAMNQILSEYPSGSFFTLNGRACSHGSNAVKCPVCGYGGNNSCANCSLISISKAKGVSIPSGQGCAHTCVGFAAYVMNQVFGLNYSAKSQVGSARKPVNKAESYQDARVGDFIYFYGSNKQFRHVSVCMRVTSNAITLYECNSSSKPSEVLCRTIPYSQIKTYHPSFVYCTIYRANNYDAVNQRIADCGGQHTKGTFLFNESAHPHYGYYSCSVCGEKFTDGSTTTMDSCELCNPNQTGMGSWSEWSTTPAYASATRQVETRQVQISEKRVEYRYGGYYTTDGKHECWCATYLKNKFGSATLRYSDWSTTQYSMNGQFWTCGNCSGPHIGADHCGNDGRMWWAEYTLPSGCYNWEESRTIEAQYETQYRYRDKTSSEDDKTSGHWGSWSEWSDSAVSASDTRQVETKQGEDSSARTEYRYGRYVYFDSRRHECWCETYMTKLFGSATLQYSDWGTTRYSPTGKGWTCGTCRGNHIGIDHYSNGKPYWAEYSLPDGDYFWEETRTVAATQKTQYRYRDWINE